MNHFYNDVVRTTLNWEIRILQYFLIENKIVNSSQVVFIALFDCWRTACWNIFVLHTDSERHKRVLPLCRRPWPRRGLNFSLDSTCKPKFGTGPARVRNPVWLFECRLHKRSYAQCLMQLGKTTGDFWLATWKKYKEV